MTQPSHHRFSLLIASWFTAIVWTAIVSLKIQPVVNVDPPVLSFLRTHGNPDLTLFFSIVTAMANPATVIVLGLTITVATVVMAKNTLALKAVFFIVIGNLMLHLVKGWVARPRPLLQIVPTGGYSFPSGHTFNAVLLAILFWQIIGPLLRSRKTRVMVISLLVVWVALVGLSRMYLQVHYPTDILGGLLYAWAWFETSEWLFSRTHLSTPRGPR